MNKTAGIKYTKNAAGRKRYLCIDLDMYGENQLIEDLVDLLDTELSKGDETISLEEFNRYIDKRIAGNV
jgi:heat shock protein HslJ